MNVKSKIVLFVGLIVLLAIFRYVADKYFYDPFIIFFEQDYIGIPFPDINVARYIFFNAFRFGVNSIISIAILALFITFSKYKTFLFKIYLISFLVLQAILLLQLYFPLNGNYVLFFYVRRILIHPVLVLVLIPAFLFQKLQSTKK